MILACVAITAALSSCTKEVTVEHTKTDTLYSNLYLPITVQAITANKWMLQELRGVLGGTNRYYLRGGTSNTENFDDEYIQFNADKTGSYHDQSGATRSITWSFDNADNTHLTIYYTNTPANFNVYWDNIRLKDKKLYFDTYYTDGNLHLNEHSQDIRIPKP